MGSPVEVVMTTVSAERLAEVFVEVADTLVDEFDVIEFLQMLTSRTAELIDASAAGLLLADQYGQLRFVAASNESVRLLELFQVQNQEGPCLDAFRRSEPVINADLQEAGDQWPAFAPRAAAAGFRSVHAIPLRLRTEVIGALNLFGTDVGSLGPSDVHIVQALADVATIGLLQERAIQRGEVVAEQLQSALNSRVVIEQAKGAVAQLRGVSVDEAFELLRGHARRNRHRLVDVAHSVLRDPASIPDLSHRRHEGSPSDG
jgi:transcriptional regulator with GAF, ATPase, and Fis domain